MLSLPRPNRCVPFPIDQSEVSVCDTLLTGNHLSTSTLRVSEDMFFSSLINENFQNIKELIKEI